MTRAFRFSGSCTRNEKQQQTWHRQAAYRRRDDKPQICMKVTWPPVRTRLGNFNNVAVNRKKLNAKKFQKNKTEGNALLGAKHAISSPLVVRSFVLVHVMSQIDKQQRPTRRAREARNTSKMTRPDVRVPFVHCGWDLQSRFYYIIIHHALRYCRWLLDNVVALLSPVPLNLALFITRFFFSTLWLKRNEAEIGKIKRAALQMKAYTRKECVKAG